MKAVVGVLNDIWDPIGVVPMGVSDEYDGYARTLTAMILRGDADTEMLDHLRWAESTNMGLESFDDERGLRVVAALKDIPKN